MGTAEDFADNFLSHYGVKGMKWGVRKDRAERRAAAKGETFAFKRVTPKPQKAFKRSSPKPEASADKKEATRIQSKVQKKSNTSALSNDDLRKVNERMRLEQEYSRLTNSNQTKSGSAWVSKTAKEIGQNQVKRVANDLAAQKVNELIKKSRT